MVSTFYGLPLEKGGEAFLLRTPDPDGREWSILVDAGYERKDDNPLIAALNRHAPDLRRIDVAVCTHEDSDHCQGFPQFVEEWLDGGNEIGELWLPGRWSVAFPQILTKPRATADAIVEGAFEAAPEIRSASWTDDEVGLMGRVEVEPSLAQAIAMAAARSGEEFSAMTLKLDRDRAALSEEQESWHGLPDDFDIDILLDYEDEAVLQSFGAESFGRLARRSRFYKVRERLLAIAEEDELAAQLANSALEIADRVRRIAVAALAGNVPVRWFDFGRFKDDGAASGGYPGFLTPANAVEVRPVPAPASSKLLFFSLQLTKANVESLVLVRHQTDSEPCVIFSGDSRFAHGEGKPSGDFPRPDGLPVSRRPLVTAPHHGSRTNDHGYKVLRDWLNHDAEQALFVRNGGSHVKVVDSYLQMPERLCV
ncbi:MAG TPA: MBL fold metallo-hydrolase, partial [Allosphingosinicella sp.]|nr:MBL fold metallo-hydrolase [Allosphingosinicella sp.]